MVFSLARCLVVSIQLPTASSGQMASVMPVGGESDRNDKDELIAPSEGPLKHFANIATDIDGASYVRALAAH